MQAIQRLNNNRTVTVKRDELLNVLKANADVHKAEFEEALTAWNAETKSRLLVYAQEVVQQAEDIESIQNLSLNARINPKPTSFTKAYEDAISMFGMDTREEVELTTTKFGAYVRDEWDWTANFKSVHSAYVNASNAR